MSQQENNGPVEVIRDGAISAKIWRNEVEAQPLPFYSVTFQRTYTDQATQEVRETHSFNGTDLLKVQQLAPEAYRTVSQLRARDRAELQQEQSPQQDQAQMQYSLSQQRDAAMNAVPRNQQHGPAPEREPEI